LRAVALLSLVPRDRIFFDLFLQSGQNSFRAAVLLRDMLEKWPDDGGLARDILKAESEGDKITHEIIRRLNSTFVTPLDREEGLDHLAHFRRSAGLERLDGRFLADRIGGLRQPGERPGRHAHQVRGQREAHREQQQQPRREVFEAAERLVRNGGVEYRDAAVLQPDLHHQREGAGQREIEMPRQPGFEGADAGRAGARRDLDVHRPARADLLLQRRGKGLLVGIVLGEAVLHRDDAAAELDAQVRAANLPRDQVALGGRQAAQDAGRLRDARRDLVGGQAVHRAAAVEEVEHQRGGLRGEQAGGQHQQGAAEKRRGHQRAQSSRSTGTAST
jgi:hypothetical protein